MNSYILKNSNKKEEMLLYQERASYSFVPKKSLKYVSKITVLDTDLLDGIWEEKLKKKYNVFLSIIHKLLEIEDEGSALVAYTEIERIKEYLRSLDKNSVSKKLLDEYMEKIYVVEMKVHAFYNRELYESVGRGR